MRVPSIAVLAAAAALAGITPGCGGSVFTGASGGGDSGTPEGGAGDAGPGPSDGGGGPDGGGVDGSPPWSPVCPASLPASGSSCAGQDVQCEYGDAWWSVSCDSVAQCQGGQWTTFQPSFEPCSAKPGPNAASCPADFASVPQGAACATNGLSCIYDQGECSCEVPLEGPVEIDGGTGYWGCVPEQGCPFPRPRLGSPCHGNMSCTYEECSYAQTCQGGVWQAEEEACAGTGNAPGQ
jgi:hypothetical protein